MADNKQCTAIDTAEAKNIPYNTRSNLLELQFNLIQKYVLSFAKF